MGLLGNIFNNPKQGQIRTLLGEYYNPKAARWNAVGSALEGLGVGLATGDWGQALQTSQDAHNSYMKNAVQGYELGQAKADQEWQAKERARKESEWAQEDATAAQMNSLLGTIEDPIQKLWAQTSPESYFKAQYGPGEMKVVGDSIYDTKSGQWMTAPGGGASKAKLPPGYRWREDGTAEVIPGVVLPNRNDKLTSTDLKELYDADEASASSQNVINTLDAILKPDASKKSLNDRAGYGAGADLYAWAARNDPFGIFSDETGQATTELRTAITEQALQSLKATFGGNPTEGERQILLDLQASVDKTPQERAAIIRRAKEAAARRLAFARNKASAIRNREYTTPGYDPTANMGGALTTEDGYTIEPVE